MRLVFYLAYILLPALQVILPGQQQVARPEEVVAWSLRVEPQPVYPGEQALLYVEGAIASGWHLYAMDSPAGKPLHVRVVQPPEGLQVGSPEQDTPLEGYDPNFDTTVRYFEDRVTVRLPLVLSTQLTPDTYPLQVDITYMVCNDRICLPPHTVTKEVAFQVEAGAPRETFQTDGTVVEASTGAVGRRFDGYRKGGLWAFLLLAMGAGLAALLTPCVFPMIPLTVSYFTHHAGDRKRAIRMALAYGSAIVLTFTSLGVLAAVFVGASGAQTIAANPWVNLFVGLIFIFFALALLGMFELRLPARWVNYVNQQSSTRSGYLGVLFMGLTLTLVSFSCTAPFVGTLLAATVYNEWSWPVLGMLVFSATFALPFVLFALFPHWLTALPRSGVWMNTVKVTLGFVELAAAFKFLSNADLVWGWGIFSRPLVIASWIAIFVLAGFYLLGMLRLAHEEPPEAVSVPRMLVAGTFFSLAVYLLPGLLGASLNFWDAYLPPRQVTDVSLIGTFASMSPASQESVDGLTWIEDRKAAFARAREEGKPVFIDFTGYTCTNCRQMEANVFPRSSVHSRLAEHFVLLRLYTDDAEKGPELQRYQLRLTGTVALPTYAIVTPDGELLIQWNGLASVDEFVSFLDEGLRKFQQVQP